MADLIDKDNVPTIEDTNEQLDLLEKNLSAVYVSLISVNTETTKMIQNMTYMQELICEISNIDLSKSKLGLSLNCLSDDFENMFKTANLLKEVLNSIESGSKMKEQIFSDAFSSTGAFSDMYNVWENVFNEVDFSNVLNEMYWSQIGEKIGVKAMKMIRKGVLKKFLGKHPVLTMLSAVLKAMGGKQAAKSALSLMFEPLSSYIPWLMLPEVVDYYLNLARESADLTEKIEELGEEEGRIAAGNGIWDKAALYQYDMQKADSDILNARLFSNKNKKEEVEENVDFSNWLSQMELDVDVLMQTLESLFSLETWQELGNNIRIGIEESWNEFVTWFNETAFGKWLNESLLPWFTKEKWLELLGNIRIAVEDFWNQFTEWFNETAFGKWLNESLLPWFTKDKWKELLDNIKKAVEEKWNEFTTWFSNTGFGKWINEDVMPWFTEEKWLEILKGVKEAFPKIFEDSINEVIKVINKFIDWVNENLKIEWEALDVDGERIFGAGSFQLFTIPHIPTFSIGGFPEDGLFMANHNELVGQFSNGKTVVANNEQIVSGIKYGVKEAVSEVLTPYLADIAQNTRETANKDFATYIGDKEIARASERGRRAMGLQLITEF